jgi:hypothetical protein
LIKRLYFFIDHIGSAFKFHGKAYHNRLANWPNAPSRRRATRFETWNIPSFKMSKYTMPEDDGPTAAVVEDGCVAFNTESCTVIVAETKTGKVIWQEWLGDPLMSQPAISKSRLYIA